MTKESVKSKKTAVKSKKESVKSKKYTGGNTVIISKTYIQKFILKFLQNKEIREYIYKILYDIYINRDKNYLNNYLINKGFDDATIDRINIFINDPNNINLIKSLRTRGFTPDIINNFINNDNNLLLIFDLIKYLLKKR